MNTSLSQEDFELIELYLDGSLDAASMEAVLMRIRQDEMFASTVEEIKGLQFGLERAALASRLDAFHDDLSHSDKPAIGKVRSLWFWGVAASLFLVMSAGIWWMMGQKSPGEELYQAYFRPDPGLVTTMSGESDYEFDRGMVDYKSGDYAQSLEFWQPLLEQAPDNDTLLYFVGLDYLQIGEIREAKKLLGQVIQNKESQFLRDANWYLGLAYVKEGQLSEAIPYLKTSEKEQAKSLIARIEKSTE